jgi:phage host-nuclease inhibitor protein Gam
VIKLLSLSTKNLDKEPISRILKLTNDLGYEVKRAIFEKEMTDRKAEVQFDYD